MRKSARVLSLCLLLALVLSLGMPAAFAEGDSDPSPVDEPEVHEHTYGDWVVTNPATCGAEGEEQRECSGCESKETRTIPATGHKWGEWEVVTAATCTESGSEKRVCSVCGAEEIREIPATGHTWGEWEAVTAATCTESGSEKRVCSVCGAEETREIPATGHTYGDWTVTKEATCTEVGSKECVCESCNDRKSEEIPATGHTEEVIPGKAATCTETGLTEGKKCSVCGVTLVAQEVIPALGHDWGVWTNTGDGKTHVRVCANDPSHVQYQNHKMGPWETVKYNTETTDGYRQRWCLAPDCDYHETQVIKAGVPKTGDSSNILLYSGLCLAAVCGAAGVLVYAKKKKAD